MIYLQDYKTDKATFRLFGEAGIKIRKYSPMPTSLYMQQNGATTTTGKNDEGVECPANICELMNDLNVVYS